MICSVLQSPQEAAAEARSVALRPQIHDISDLNVVPIGYIAASLVDKPRENSRDLPSDRQHPSPINFGRSCCVRNRESEGLQSSAKFVRLLTSDCGRHCQQSTVSARSRIERHQHLRWEPRRDAFPSSARYHSDWKRTSLATRNQRRNTGSSAKCDGDDSMNN